MDKPDKYLDELQAHTGEVLRGDITPVVYDILKDTKDIDGLIDMLRGVKHVHNKKSDTISCDQSSHGYSIE